VFFVTWRLPSTLFSQTRLTPPVGGVPEVSSIWTLPLMRLRRTWTQAASSVWMFPPTVTPSTSSAPSKATWMLPSTLVFEVTSVARERAGRAVRYDDVVEFAANDVADAGVVVVAAPAATAGAAAGATRAAAAPAAARRRTRQARALSARVAREVARAQRRGHVVEALEVLSHRVGDDLEAPAARGVVAELEITSDGVARHGDRDGGAGGHVAVLDLEVAPDDVAAGAADVEGRLVAVELEVAVDREPADGIRSEAGREPERLLDLDVAADAGPDQVHEARLVRLDVAADLTRQGHERTAAGDLHVAPHTRSIERTDRTVGHDDGVGEDRVDEDAIADFVPRERGTTNENKKERESRIDEEGPSHGRLREVENRFDRRFTEGTRPSEPFAGPTPWIRFESIFPDLRGKFSQVSGSFLPWGLKGPMSCLF
jgi:hypothetical protein